MTTHANAPKARKPTCFVAMPITTHDDEAERYDDPDHWRHVIESLFIKAIEAAGFTPIRPETQGSHLIHGQIIRHLVEADLVLCDLSQHNPNVFFELGVRTSLNRPIALVKDEHTHLPFDTSGINTYEYSSSLRGWEIEAQQEALKKHIEASAKSCAGENPLWRHFGLTIKAREPDAHASPVEAKLDILSARLAQMQHQLEHHQSTQSEKHSITINRAGVDSLFEHVNRETSKKDAFEYDANRWIERSGAPISLSVTDDHLAFAFITDEAALEPEHVTRLESIALRYNMNLHVMPLRDSANAPKPAQRRPQRGDASRPRVL